MLFVCHQPAKQLRARQVITDFIEENPGPGAKSMKRLKVLQVAARSRHRPPERGGLADRIATAAITVLADPDHLFPIAGKGLLVLPVPSTETPAEDPLRGETWEVLKSELGAEIQSYPIPVEPPSAVYADLAQRAFEVPLLIIALLGARFNEAQRQLAQQAVEWNDRVIFILFGDPFDADVLPRRGSPTIVCAYGFRPVHQRAVAAVLKGDVTATGSCPVELKHYR